MEQSVVREFERPLVICQNCKSEIHWSNDVYSHSSARTVTSYAPIPPAVKEPCPNCNVMVDTRAAYPAMPGFPISFSLLKGAYTDFEVPDLAQQSSLEEIIHAIYATHDIRGLMGELNHPDRLAWYKGQLFHRSCKSFYRSLQLYFAYLILERHCFLTWAKVTAYYSRFYFIQSFLNLSLATWFELDNLFVFFDGTGFTCLTKKGLTDSPTLKKARSHEVWWQFMEAMKRPDYPIADLDFVLSRLVFNPAARNIANYDFRRQHGGFIELDWFDLSPYQMLSQLMPNPRCDLDITDIDRYFSEMAPDDCEAADFYSDEAQLQWSNFSAYLAMIIKLGIRQNYVCTPKIALLASVCLGKEYPNLMNGILTSATEILQDSFNVAHFTELHHENCGHHGWLAEFLCPHDS